MSQNFHHTTGSCSSNEDLALQIQVGDIDAVEQLILQNEGYLTNLALKHSEWCDLDKLKQEGTLVLLEASKQLDPAHGTKLLTYATPAIESAMMDYASHSSPAIHIPPSRYHQLCRVAHIFSKAQDRSESVLVDAVCKKLEVSPKVAAALINEYQMLFRVRQLGDDAFSISCGGDPAKAYDRYMRQKLLLQQMEAVLTSRELNLVRNHLGIGQPDGTEMAFQELAIRLNYDGPSGAEKACKTALRKLKFGAYGHWISIQKVINKAKAEAEADP